MRRACAANARSLLWRTSDVPLVLGDSGRVAIVLLVHQDPVHFHRLVRALDGFPIVVHCDTRASDDDFAAMQRGAPQNVSFVERGRTAWGSWSLVDAELRTLDAALKRASSEHFVTLSGSDYPLVSAEELSNVLKAFERRSFVGTFPLPFANWGPDGGFDRLRFRYVNIFGRRTRIPLRRGLPNGLTFAGASVSKILCRIHAEKLLEVRDSRPDLVRFWKTTETPDETFIPTVLESFVVSDPSEIVTPPTWYIDWQGVGNRSPKWLDAADWDQLVGRRNDATAEVPLLFGRKFSTTHSSQLLDRIDLEFGVVGNRRS